MDGERARWRRAHRIRGFESCFTFYLHGLIRRNFSRVWSAGSDALPAGGYVAAANHHSWWDGLIPYYLHRLQQRDRPFAIMMSDRELRRFPYFRFGGAFSVDARSVRAAREAILYAAQEARAGAAVWIFPEGELRAPTAPLSFTSGFAHAAREADVPIVPVAMRFVMRARQRPEAFVRFGAPLPAGRAAQRGVQDEVAAMLDAIDRAIECDSVEREFSLVTAGRAGADDVLALARH